MNRIKLENILLTFGNRLLEVAGNKDNPTLGELIDTPADEIEKHVTNTTIKQFVRTHDDKYSDFILGLDAGYIDGEGHICQAQHGIQDTFAVGMPVYDTQEKLIGNLSIGLFEHLDYAERASNGMEIPVYYWRVDGYEGERQNIKTYHQVLAAPELNVPNGTPTITQRGED